MKSTIIPSVTMAIGIVSATARATTIPAHGVDPQFLSFAKCVQGHHPGFLHNGSIPTSSDIGDCVDQVQRNQELRSTTTKLNKMAILPLLETFKQIGAIGKIASLTTITTLP